MPLTTFSDQIDENFFQTISNLADETEQQRSWPQQQLRMLAEVGILGWNIPDEYEGHLQPPVTQAAMTLRLSAACLTTAFVLSQRDAACQRILACSNEPIKRELLPVLASGDQWATVGISHLSTSRQHLKKPSVQAIETAGGYELSGFVPWVTGAMHSDVIVTGGALEDGRQLLVALDKNSHTQVSFSLPAEMLALTASQTGNVTIDSIEVPKDRILIGPIENVMKAGGGGTGSLTTSLIAAGVASRAVDAFVEEASSRSDLAEEASALKSECESLINDLLDASNPDRAANVAHEKATLRTRANSLVLRASQAYLTATKGTGFMKGHPAERTIREAMFFLVWSCPAPVAQSAMKEFACTPSWA